MRILFISTHFPDDLRKNVHGVYKRMRTFLDAIKEIAEIDMLIYAPAEKCMPGASRELENAFLEHWNIKLKLHLCPKAEFNEDTELQKWLSFGRGVFSFYKQRGMVEYSGRQQIAALEKCIDKGTSAIFAHRLSAMCPLLLTQIPLPPVFFDMDDIEHVVLSRYIKERSSLRSNLLKLLIRPLINGEYSAVKLAESTFVCSEGDRLYLERKFKLPGIHVVPNSVNVTRLEPLTQEHNILFLASDYGPNIQAAEFLIRDIWPMVRNKVPDARLIIAGVSPTKLSTNDIPGLELPGFVENLDELYKTARVVVAPMLVGGGTRFKIIEAAIYAKPTVSTKVGAEGIELIDGEEIFIRNEAKEFSETCIELLSNMDLCMKTGALAREKATLYYNRENVVELIKKHISDKIS